MVHVVSAFYNDLVLKVCLDSSENQCTSCGTILYSELDNTNPIWHKVECAEETKGNRVSIHQPSYEASYIVICELNVTGTG